MGGVGARVCGWRKFETRDVATRNAAARRADLLMRKG
jgi:hypothetical protein